MFSPAGTRSRPSRDAGGRGEGGGRPTPFKQRDGRLQGYGGGGGQRGGADDAESPSTPLVSYPHVSPETSFSPSTSRSHRKISSTRSPPLAKILDKDGIDSNLPVFVSDFPQELRIAQAEEVAHLRPDQSIFGGMDQPTGLSWMLQHARLFLWSHVSSQAPESFSILQMPQLVCTDDGENIDPRHGDGWAVCLVGLQKDLQTKNSNYIENCKSAGLIMCSRKSSAVIYWPDIFSKTNNMPIVSLPSGEDNRGEEKLNAPTVWKSPTSWGGVSTSQVNALVASAHSGSGAGGCVAIACRSNGELERFDCSSRGISRDCIARVEDPGPAHGEVSDSFFIRNTPGARTVVWLNNEGSVMEGWRQLLLLTATGLECWDIELNLGGQVSLAWAFDVLADLDSGKMLAGQKQVWLLDVQVETAKKRLKLLLASFSKDRINSSSYMQYFLVTYSWHSKSAQREGGIQVILPKARIEEEEFLYSMRLRLGGKPEGSSMILARDGTATIAHCNGGNVKLYQFDLAWDAGKVLDACVLPSSDENEGGTWLVLTEKAGVWAIPGKAVLVCGVEPPERSLSRRGSQNEGSGRDDRRWSAFGNNSILVRKDSEIGGSGGRNETPLVQGQSAHNGEAEALVAQCFQEFLSTGHTHGVLEKLHQAGAFDKEGNMSAFALASRGLIDTLAKQWTTGTASSAAMMAVVSSQLAEKQRRHQQFLQFLLASRCHDELLQKQRSALQLILEHGEKLAAMMWLREFHNMSVQARLQSSPALAKSSDIKLGESAGALWDLVQIVGEKARRNNVMLLDREKAEVFYSRVSDLEDLFSVIHMHIDMIVGRETDQPVQLQVEKVGEVSHACTKALQTAICFKDSQQSWYPSPEGLTPWYCKPVVRSGLWRLATLIIELQEEATVLLPSIVAILMSHLEALADVLLEAYAGAITAKVECEEEYKGLQMEYWNRRDMLLGAMYQYAKRTVEAVLEGDRLPDGGEKKLSVLQKFYPPLMALAKRHAGYQTLWDICTDLNDMDCLRSLMHESMGLKEGRFSNFVFEKCYQNCQYSKLLRLGEEFREELSLFLQSHKDLLWLHELYLQHFALASSTLRWLALSTEEAVSATIETAQGNLKASCKYGRLKLLYRKRLLNLAKLSAFAGGDVDLEERALNIDADIGMLNVQEKAFQLGIVADDDVLTPRQLVEVCLNSESRDLVLQAFDVFAWGGDMFRKSNKSLLENAWLRAADQDDWATMRQVSERDGWSDEQHLEALRSTVLYYASKRCYGEYSFCLGGSFGNVLPLLQEETEGLEHVGSVETVLMQHRDFPDAGHAMLTAIRMGKGE